MSRRHLWSYGALEGFLRSNDVRSLAQASKSSQSSFSNGDFFIHLRVETTQISHIIEKNRPARDVVLSRILTGLDRLPKSPLLTLHIFEQGTFRNLFPLVLSVLKHCSNLQVLHLCDICVSPIRAESAAGEFMLQQALQLTGAFDFGASAHGPGRNLRKLWVTAGTWSWEALCILFESLSKCQTLKSLMLRGKLAEAKGKHERSLDIKKDKDLSVLKVLDFSWQGSNIYDASFLERIVLALPLAQLSFRMEMSGGWRGAFEAELKEFEQLSRLKRIKVLNDNKGNFVDLEPGVLTECREVFPTPLRSMMCLNIAPAGSG